MQILFALGTVGLVQGLFALLFVSATGGPDGLARILSIPVGLSCLVLLVVLVDHLARRMPERKAAADGSRA